MSMPSCSPRPRSSMPSRRSPRCAPASTCRSRSRCATTLADGEAVVAAHQGTGLVAMVGHTRRFNPSHQWIHRRVVGGELAIQQMDVQTYFFRRTNTNALGQPRSWTDHLLWHHAAHTVDLFSVPDGEPDRGRQRVAGSDPPRARHRDGHVDPAQDRESGDLHAVAVVQQRRSVRDDVPVHR